MSARSARRRWWALLGAAFVVGGLVAAVLLWNGASQRRNTAIENFARAPIGCDTTLDFVETGEYLLFVETNGNLDDVRGDCDVEGSYDNAARDVPDVEITLVDPDGNELDLDTSIEEVEYDAAGFRGVALSSVDIADTDDHVLRAESDADGVFVVAIGRDPDDGVATLRAGSIAAGVFGVLVGLALVLVGARRSSAAVPSSPWTAGVPTQPPAFVPGTPAPQGPPVFGQPTGPPSFGQFPQSGQQPPSQPPAPHSWQRIPDESDTFGRSSSAPAPTGPPDREPRIDWSPPPPLRPPANPPSSPTSPTSDPSGETQ